MKYADRRGAPVAVMLGGDEIAAGTVTLKDLDAGRRLSQAVSDNAEWKQARPGQQTLPRDQMVSAIRSILEGTSISG
jgi:histidyl-tRNA synthetase